MKAHLHRIMNCLPDLLASPMVKELNVVIHDQWTIGPVVEVATDHLSVFLCEKHLLRDDGALSWHCIDKEDVNGLEVILNDNECENAGLPARLDAVLNHIDGDRRRRIAVALVE